jgi:hypothetical protein
MLKAQGSTIGGLGKGDQLHKIPVCDHVPTAPPKDGGIQRNAFIYTVIYASRSEAHVTIGVEYTLK